MKKQSSIPDATFYQCPPPPAPKNKKNEKAISSDFWNSSFSFGFIDEYSRLICITSILLTSELQLISEEILRS